MRSGELRQNSFLHAAVHSFLLTWVVLNNLQQMSPLGDLGAQFFPENCQKSHVLGAQVMLCGRILQY